MTDLLREAKRQKGVFDMLKREGIVPHDEVFTPLFDDETIWENVAVRNALLKEDRGLEEFGVLPLHIEEAIEEAAEFWDRVSPYKF